MAAPAKKEDSSSELYDKKKDKLSEEKYDYRGSGTCKAKNETIAKDRFKGKNVIITGGAGNFGIRCAERFASEGANVALWDIRDPSEVASRIEKEFPGIKARGYVVDVTSEKTVNDATNKVVKEFGSVDLCFNNAGYQGDFKQTHLYGVDDFRKVIDINVTGVFIVLKYVANAMMENPGNRGGSMVVTASAAGHGCPPNMIAYATSKAAVSHMVKIAAKDLAPFNVRVNAVSPAFIGPGFMWTRQIELQAGAGSAYYDKDPVKVAKAMINTPAMKRYGSIDEVMGPVLFLLSDDSSYLTGIDIEITGGIL